MCAPRSRGEQVVNAPLLESQLTGPLLVTSVAFYNLPPPVPGIRREAPYWRISGAVPQNSHLIYSRKGSATNIAPERRLESPQVWRLPQGSCSALRGPGKRGTQVREED